MAITYTLVPVPKWYWADTTGRPLGAGKMYTYSSLDQITPKPVYMDVGGLLPYTNPVLFDENGMQGPFFWAFDTTNTSDGYYLEIYDKDDNLIDTFTQYGPGFAGGGGGGDTIVNYNLDFVNHLPNNIFFRNIGASTGTAVLNGTWLAPGTTTKAEYRNWYYRTNFDALDRVDSIKFLPFNKGVNTLLNDVTPEEYLNYTCGSAGAGETQKAIAIQVSASTTALSNQVCTFTIWARCNSGANSITIIGRQFFGTGGTTPSPDQVTIASIATLTSGWTKHVFNFTWPSTIGKVLGTCGNDGSYININFPIGAATNIDLIKPCLYLGNFGTILTSPEYQTYDEIDSIIAKPHTGDVRISYAIEGIDEARRMGWLLLDDGVIGSANIIAPPSIAITRKNIDTYFLYREIWNATTANPAFAQVYDTSGVAVPRSGNPQTDFALNRSMRLPVQLGLAIAAQGKPSTLQNIGTTWAPGQANGEETHVLAKTEMPLHDHLGPKAATLFAAIGTISGGSGQAYSPGTVPNPAGEIPIVTVQPEGGGNAHNTIQPTQRYYVYMKL